MPGVRGVGTGAMLVCVLLAGCHRHPAPTYEYEETETQTWTGTDPVPPAEPESSPTSRVTDDRDGTAVPVAPQPTQGAIEPETTPSAPSPAPVEIDATVDEAPEPGPDPEPAVPPTGVHPWYKAKSW